MTDAMVRFENVSFAYGSARAILRGVSATAARGQFIALVGPSGSGKTTLLKTINRLITPTSGAVYYDGRDVREAAPADLRRRIGYVFQNLGLFPHMSIGENIAIGPRLAGWPRAEAEARVRELLTLVDLPQEFATRPPASLSGGQKQRVALARALAARPSLMLMDEPFGALDPPTREALMDAYLGIHRRAGTTTLMVTHDMSEALLAADRIFVLADGALVADATPQELMRSDAPAVADLVSAPRRQAERLRALSDGFAA